MTVQQATILLMNHRNGIETVSYADRKTAINAIAHLVTEWVQTIDGVWQLVIIGYLD